jgi:hypothetical protein
MYTSSIYYLQYIARRIMPIHSYIYTFNTLRMDFFSVLYPHCDQVMHAI